MQLTKTSIKSCHCSVTTSCVPSLSLSCLPLHCHPSFPVTPSVKEMQTFYNEVAILKKVSRRGHPHVITMVGYIVQDRPPAIVMEFAPLGTLHDFLAKVKNEVKSCRSNKHFLCVPCMHSFQSKVGRHD